MVMSHMLYRTDQSSSACRTIGIQLTHYGNPMGVDEGGQVSQNLALLRTPLGELMTERGFPSPYATSGWDPPSALAMRPPRIPARSTSMGNPNDLTYTIILSCQGLCRTSSCVVSALFVIISSSSLLEGLGSALSSPSGTRGGPHRPKIHLLHSKAMRMPLVAIILSILKCIFYTRTIKI